MSKINAVVVADSLSPQGHRLTSMLVTFPRIILAELNTHRILSKNTASSRAIPFKKMMQSVQENPFTPIAWQKDHKGMQGTEYFTDEYGDVETLTNYYLEARDSAVRRAKDIYEKGATKQICNRLLEPFMWVTALISGTEWENFFELRCPQYDLGDGVFHKSRKDALKYAENVLHLEALDGIFLTEIDWLLANKGQAEIHMMALAEAVWDARNESKPKQLKAGEWHIVFEDKIDMTKVVYNEFTDNYMGRWYGKAMKVPIATSMAARTSFTVVGDEKEINYERMMKLHDEMAIAKPFHATPFEHNARTMNDEQYSQFTKTMPPNKDLNNYDYLDQANVQVNVQSGWCRNFRGFIQYRHIIETREQYE